MARKFQYVFKSGIEDDAFDFLRRFAKEGKYDARYETESLPYIIEGDYKPDFVIKFEDGAKLYIETKGYLDENSRRKMVAVRKANMDKDIRIVFAKDNWLRKGAKTKYSDWAKRIGYPYAIGQIPREWLRIKDKNIG